MLIFVILGIGKGTVVGNNVILGKNMFIIKIYKDFFITR